MNAAGFFVMAGVFIALMLVYKYAEKWIKKIPRKAAKTINWTGFTVATFAGIAWYLTNDDTFMFITLGGVITYFLFFSYDKHGDKEEPKADLT